MKLFGLYLFINVLLIVIIAFLESLAFRIALGIEVLILFFLNIRFMQKDL